MLLSLERLLVVGACVVAPAWAKRLSRNGSETIGRPGSERTCANGNWGSPGTWELLSFSRKQSRTGIPGEQPQARERRSRSRRGSETCVIPWHRQAKATKRGGMDDRMSQCLDSTGEAGEQTPVRPSAMVPAPWREARHREYGIVVGTYDGYRRFECTYYRNSNG
jgi:hypothetical protein